MLTNVCRRRTFLGGFGAALGSAILPATAFAKAGEPIVRFGVASGVHIAVGWKEGGDPERLGLRSQPYFLEKALRWFDANKVDAVVFSGDMAHTGRMEELEKLVEVWNKVFPGMKRSDGEKVERMLVTGNHEIGQWPGLWSRYTDEQLRKIRFDYDREHINANWRKLFGEDYRLIWKREVKGITFVGAHYPRGTDYQKGWHRPDYFRTPSPSPGTRTIRRSTSAASGKVASPRSAAARSRRRGPLIGSSITTTAALRIGRATRTSACSVRPRRATTGATACCSRSMPTIS